MGLMCTCVCVCVGGGGGGVGTWGTIMFIDREVAHAGCLV